MLYQCFLQLACEIWAIWEFSNTLETDWQLGGGFPINVHMWVCCPYARNLLSVTLALTSTSLQQLCLIYKPVELPLIQINCAVINSFYDTDTEVWTFLLSHKLFLNSLLLYFKQTNLPRHPNWEKYGLNKSVCLQLMIKPWSVAKFWFAQTIV